MTDLFFVDTNVLVYRRDADEQGKQRRAYQWLDQLFAGDTGRVSYQVLVEYYSTAVRKARIPASANVIRRDVRALMVWNPVPNSPELIDDAWRLEDRYHLSWWDSLIVAAAQRAECQYLLSEDFQAGQDFDGVTVVDPFSTAPAEVSR